MKLTQKPSEIEFFLFLTLVEHSVTRCADICLDCRIVSVWLPVVFHTILSDRVRQILLCLLLERLRSEQQQN